MKIKLLIFFYLITTAFAAAQDTAIVPDSITFTEVPDEYDAEAETVQYKRATVAPPQKPVYATRAFNEGFKDKYNSGEFKYVDKPVEKSLWDRFWEWIARVFGGGFNSNADGSVSTFGFLLYFISGLVILFVAYFIARAIMNKESIWIFGRSRKIAVYNAEEENIHEMDFARLIEQTRTDGNYRLAVRYYYLWLLKKLSYKEIIAWHIDKTNSDYYY
ncbi:MAG: hypothetical protein EOP54_30040, partial [Sphingobacteriales bacterium]